MVKMNGIPVYSDGIDIRDLGEEVILISADGNFMHTLVDTGRFIWKSIDGKNSVNSILNMVCKEYNVEIDRAKPDLLSFINSLILKKLIFIDSEDK